MDTCLSISRRHWQAALDLAVRAGFVPSDHNWYAQVDKVWVDPEDMRRRWHHHGGTHIGFLREDAVGLADAIRSGAAMIEGEVQASAETVARFAQQGTFTFCRSRQDFETFHLKHLTDPWEVRLTWRQLAVEVNGSEPPSVHLDVPVHLVGKLLRVAAMLGFTPRDIGHTAPSPARMQQDWFNYWSNRAGFGDRDASELGRCLLAATPDQIYHGAELPAGFNFEGNPLTAIAEEMGQLAVRDGFLLGQRYGQRAAEFAPSSRKFVRLIQPA